MLAAVAPAALSAIPNSRERAQSSCRAMMYYKLRCQAGRLAQYPRDKHVLLLCTEQTSQMLSALLDHSLGTKEKGFRRAGPAPLAQQEILLAAETSGGGTELGSNSSSITQFKQGLISSPLVCSSTSICSSVNWRSW